MTDKKKTPNASLILELFQESLDKISDLRDRLDDKKTNAKSIDSELLGIGNKILAASYYIRK